MSGPPPRERRSAPPLYDQLQRSLRRSIEDGTLAAGDPLPGEHRLCEIHAVSRTVVRQALGMLEHEGVIVRIKGKGTYVAPGRSSELPASRLRGLREEMAAQGGEVTGDVLRHETVPAPSQVAGQLGLAPQEDATVLERLRHVDGEPWSLSATWLPPRLGRLLDGADLAIASLYQVLEEHGVRAVSGERAVEAALTDEREGRLLHLGPQRPVLRMTSTTADERGRPIEHVVALHRGDRSRFVVPVFRGAETGHLVHGDG
ncbi:GntR family transcriptional regulator [Brachybacterium sacelli]|uniref:GntR family transcriptional regulator n=1 Tax=Brachybacterium sacelli TaxID=173364 RepID=A0ABS4WZJ7_9MICO|nr:GntR family transcriptional regulator [Brachybacterium sacelli]MBP2381629.1 GntR family transcriptional regulator [Brachybacterium sacelli]